MSTDVKAAKTSAAASSSSMLNPAGSKSLITFVVLGMALSVNLGTFWIYSPYQNKSSNLGRMWLRYPFIMTKNKFVIPATVLEEIRFPQEGCQTGRAPLFLN